MVKEKVLKAVEALPAEATYEDAMERLYVLYKVERGLRQIEAGEGIPHAAPAATDRCRRWGCACQRSGRCACTDYGITGAEPQYGAAELPGQDYGAQLWPKSPAMSTISRMSTNPSGGSGAMS